VQGVLTIPAKWKVEGIVFRGMVKKKKEAGQSLGEIGNLCSSRPRTNKWMPLELPQDLTVVGEKGASGIGVARP